MSESSALIESLRHAASLGWRSDASDSIREWPQRGLERARLHDIYAIDTDDAAAASGFAVAVAIAAGAVPLLWVRTEEVERKAGRLLGAGFVDLGLSPAALVIASVDDEAALLRAAADAARCSGIGTLVVESRGRAPRIDLTATRRLMLAAETSGVTVLSLRIGADPTPSAATTRWGITAAPSSPLAADAPGHPGFVVDLLRQRGGPAGARWHVEWNRDAKSFVDLTDAAALSGARLPLAVDRTAPRDARAPLRRAG